MKWRLLRGNTFTYEKSLHFMLDPFQDREYEYGLLETQLKTLLGVTAEPKYKIKNVVPQ